MSIDKKKFQCLIDQVWFWLCEKKKKYNKLKIIVIIICATFVHLQTSHTISVNADADDDDDDDCVAGAEKDLVDLICTIAFACKWISGRPRQKPQTGSVTKSDQTESWIQSAPLKSVVSRISLAKTSFYWSPGRTLESAARQERSAPVFECVVAFDS